jgi:cation:H+ antiporter
VITGILIIDGRLSRFDGLLMLSLFFIWLVIAVIEARKQRSAAEKVLVKHQGWVAGVLSIVGLALLAAAGSLILGGARGMAASLGLDEFIIGAMIVALGTSIPELAITVIAKLRGHEEVALGTILGSNIFNGLLIVPVAAIISPIPVSWREVVVALACGLLAVLLTFPPREGFIERRRGALLLVLFVVYLAAMFQNIT